MEIPEFDLFKRIEELEEKTKGEFTVRDTFLLAAFSFEAAFLAFVGHDLARARKYKDVILAKLKNLGFNKDWLELIAEDLTNICDVVDEQSK